MSDEDLCICDKNGDNPFECTLFRWCNQIKVLEARLDNVYIRMRVSDPGSDHPIVDWNHDGHMSERRANDTRFYIEQFERDE